MTSVLIVSNEQDLAADLVVLELERRGVQVLRCNTERLPSWRVSVEPGGAWELTDPLGRTLNNDMTASIWWRRPEPPPGPAFSTESKRDAFVSQWQASLQALASVPGPRWISPPWAVRVAEDKAHQLAMALQLGFRVPATVWTNDAGRAAAQCEARQGQVVAKPVTTAAWEDEEGSAFVFAHLMRGDQLPAHDLLAAVPAAFQAPIARKQDVRVTVIGTRVFAAIAGTGPKGRKPQLDWRLEPDRQWWPHELDAADAKRCAELVAALGLRFGGIDLLLDGDGRPWFLEINPNGEWGWLAQAAGLPIVDALVDELTLATG